MSDDEDPFASLLGKRYHDESLRPPPESGNGEAEEDSWDRREALVDNDAYMIDRRNHTTARCPVTRRGRGGGKEDPRAPSGLAPPPHVSYFCMSYGSGDPIRFCSEPRIFGAEGDLAVIGLVHYWTLQYAPRLASCATVPGAVASNSNSPSPAATTMTPIRSQRFADMVLISTFSTPTTPWLTLGRAHPLPFHGPQDAPSPPKHLCNKVVTVGGAMGWVDLWDGMILCDVHVPAPSGEEESPGPRLLRYVPLPEPMQPDNGLPLYGMSYTSSFFRDIAVVNGRISSSTFSLDDSMSQVIAVNMKEKTVERTAKYTTQRDASMAFAYTRTTISKFLARVSDFFSVDCSVYYC
uniref:DUF1618 domain-containing protein n=1 Tax=Aegilops tauschii TaxID=37682 RepID=M8AR53_AEGTA